MWDHKLVFAVTYAAAKLQDWHVTHFFPDLCAAEFMLIRMIWHWIITLVKA